MNFSRVINNEWTPEIKLLFSTLALSFQTYHYGIIPYQLPRLLQSIPISELFIMGLGFHFQQKVPYDIGSQTIYGRLPSGQSSTEVLIFPLNGYYPLNHSQKFISGSLHCTMASIQSWYQNFRQYFNLSDMEWHCNNQGCALHFPLPCGIDWKVSRINLAKSHFLILLMILFEELLWWTRWWLV